MAVEYPYWYNAYIATTAVSILPNVLLFLIPSKLLLQKTVGGINVKHVLLCFAAAGLLGDVFIHTIPHLLGAHDHEHGHSDHGHSHGAHGIYDEDHHVHDHHHDHVADDRDHHGHDHYHDHNDHRSLTDEHSLDLFGFLATYGLEKNLVIQLVVIWGFVVFLIAEKVAKQYCAGHSHDHSHGQKHDEDDAKKSRIPTKHQSAGNTSSWVPSIFTKLQSSGWLNLFADSMHNFTDGIAIGASFANTGSGLGFATFITVIFHEIPHEIGDFTILVNNGLRLVIFVLMECLVIILVVNWKLSRRNSLLPLLL